MGKIIVTPRSLSTGEQPDLLRLEEAGHQLVFPAPGTMPSEEDLLRHVPGCLGWLAGVEPVSETVINSASDLRVISRNGSGIDSLPLNAIEDAGIKLYKAEGTNARGVAELALAFMLAGLRGIVPTHEGIRQGDWPRIPGREICDCGIGIVGLGAIGTILAELLLAMGAKVRAFDPFADTSRLAEGIELSSLENLLSDSDVITLHCPLPSDGKALLGRDEFAKLRQDAVLVNTARAALVDEPALLDCLRNNPNITYATDVFDIEPPGITALTRNAQVIMTSHIGGLTSSSVERSTERAVDNLLEGLGHAD